MSKRSRKLSKKAKSQPTKTTKLMPLNITKDYIDPKTGELKTFVLKEQEIKDYNFYKYWPKNLVGFKKVATLNERDFLDWLIENSNRDNLILGTYQSMAKDTKHSSRFIEKAIHKMEDTDVIVKVQNGAYLLNPNVLFKGSTRRRIKVSIQYKELREKQQYYHQRSKIKIIDK